MNNKLVQDSGRKPICAADDWLFVFCFRRCLRNLAWRYMLRRLSCTTCIYTNWKRMPKWCRFQMNSIEILCYSCWLVAMVEENFRFHWVAMDRKMWESLMLVKLWKYVDNWWFWSSIFGFTCEGILPVSWFQYNPRGCHWVGCDWFINMSILPLCEYKIYDSTSGDSHSQRWMHPHSCIFEQ